MSFPKPFHPEILYAERSSESDPEKVSSEGRVARKVGRCGSRPRVPVSSPSCPCAASGGTGGDPLIEGPQAHPSLDLSRSMNGANTPQNVIYLTVSPQQL